MQGPGRFCTEGSEFTTNVPPQADAEAVSPLAIYNGKVLSPAAAQRNWQYVQAGALSQVPEIGVDGSPANLAFVRAFRASGGDAKRAMQVTRAMLNIK